MRAIAEMCVLLIKARHFLVIYPFLDLDLDLFIAAEADLEARFASVALAISKQMLQHLADLLL